MTKPTKLAKLWYYGLTVLISLIILIDFSVPGNVFVEEVLRVEKQKEQYYNAARNSHYSFTLITAKHQFSVSENFAKTAQNEKVRYSVSLLFNEITKHSILSSKESTIYSFRLASGFILPVLVLGTILIAYFLKKENQILIFVLQSLLVADLILLIL